MKSAGVFILSIFVFPTVVSASADVLVYHGMSDASAAVPIADDMFVVADDENNVLRIYRLSGDLPIANSDLTDFLEVDQEHPEADIEGATKVGERIYWITSHGRNKDGKLRPSRYRFFATVVKVENNIVSIQPVGKPCKDLVDRLVNNDIGRRFNLDRVTRLEAKQLGEKERKKLAPKRQGLNIEGLCASADGMVLYIGFRNPRPSGKAFVVPLTNPVAVVEAGAEPAFGEIILWDLAGLGIRSMEYSTFHKAYFIIAGPHDEADNFALYRWSGNECNQPVFLRRLSKDRRQFSPEALMCFDNSARILLLSDDGTIAIEVSDNSECVQGKLNTDGSCPNKFLIDPDRRTFRAIWLNL